MKPSRSRSVDVLDCHHHGYWTLNHVQEHCEPGSKNAEWDEVSTKTSSSTARVQVSQPNITSSTSLSQPSPVQLPNLLHRGQPLLPEGIPSNAQTDDEFLRR